MKKIARSLACLSVFALASSLVVGQTPTSQETHEANIKAYIGMLRTDLKKGKVSILTELMALSPDQAAKFWPIYNEYDKSLTKLADERIALIRMYADNHSALSNDMATKIALGALDIQSRRLDLQKQYFQKFSQALSPK